MGETPLAASLPKGAYGGKREGDKAPRFRALGATILRQSLRGHAFSKLERRLEMCK
jgi:hypothetical protein